MAYAPFAEERLLVTSFLKLASDHLCVIQLFLFSNSRATVSWPWSLHDIFATKWKIIFKRLFWRHYGVHKFPQGKCFISLKVWKQIFSTDLQSVPLGNDRFVGIYKIGTWHIGQSIKTFSKSTLFIRNHVSFPFAQGFIIYCYIYAWLYCLMSLSMKANLKWETFKDTHTPYSQSIPFPMPAFLITQNYQHLQNIHNTRHNAYVKTYTQILLIQVRLQHCKLKTHLHSLQNGTSNTC